MEMFYVREKSSKCGEKKSGGERKRNCNKL
jgi:hypothetical protein